MTLRVPGTELAYNNAKHEGDLVPLTEEKQLEGAPIFYYWKIVKNRFPHDRHHTHHDMIVLKRDCWIHDVKIDELMELYDRVIPWADERYDYIKLNLSSMRSVKTTVHYHLLSLKPEYK